MIIGVGADWGVHSGLLPLTCCVTWVESSNLSEPCIENNISSIAPSPIFTHVEQSPILVQLKYLHALNLLSNNYMLLAGGKPTHIIMSSHLNLMTQIPNKHLTLPHILLKVPGDFLSALPGPISHLFSIFTSPMHAPWSETPLQHLPLPSRH